MANHFDRNVSLNLYLQCEKSRHIDHPWMTVNVRKSRYLSLSVFHWPPRSMAGAAFSLSPDLPSDRIYLYDTASRRYLSSSFCRIVILHISKPISSTATSFFLYLQPPRRTFLYYCTFFINWTAVSLLKPLLYSQKHLDLYFPWFTICQNAGSTAVNGAIHFYMFLLQIK